ncbi:hypothetical protein ACLOJK_034604, partial [Asimina triloba]
MERSINPKKARSKESSKAFRLRKEGEVPSQLTMGDGRSGRPFWARWAQAGGGPFR